MVRSLRLSLTTAALLTLTLGMLASSAVPASAHKSFVEHGRDFAYTSKNHRIGYVCDKERDGHRKGWNGSLDKLVAHFNKDAGVAPTACVAIEDLPNDRSLPLVDDPRDV